MNRSENKFLTLFILLLAFCADATCVRAQTDVGVSDRTELVYFIGQVNSVSGRTALVNLGEVHSLDVIDESTGKVQAVSVFRAEGSTFRPVGIASVMEARATVSEVKTDYLTNLLAGDVVMFVRQMSELRNGSHHEDHVLRAMALRQKRVANRSSAERNATAQRLAAYKSAYPKWERSRSRIAGEFFAREDLEMTPELQRLLKQINLFRTYHADGFLSVKAAGPTWSTTISPLLGADAKIKHQSATAAAADSENGERPLDIPNLRRITEEEFFDATAEQKNTGAFLVATALRKQPRSLEQWLQTQFLQTQYPEWVDNENVVERIRDAVRAIELSN